jgi:hypothetical protein
MEAPSGNPPGGAAVHGTPKQTARRKAGLL